MSDNGVQEPTVDQPIDQGATDASQTQQQEPEHPFLESVDPAHREVVSQYVKKWDANVTRRMQENANKYKPYEGLGDVEDLQRAVAFTQRLRNDPGFQRQLYDHLHGTFNQQPQQQPGLQPEGQGLGDYPELEQFLNNRFQTLEQQFGQRDQVLNAVAQYILSQHQQQSQSEEDKQLESYLGGLKTEFGDFDEEFVLVKMSAGVSGEDAVKQWKQKVQSTVNQNASKPPAFPVLSGQGSAPPGERKVTDLSDKETRALVASVLEQSQQ